MKRGGETQEETAKRLLAGGSMMTATELARHGVSAAALQRLCRKGEAVRASRGVYHLPEFEFDASYDLAQAAKRVPAGVVCLLSAAVHHGLTDQNPGDVWMAVPSGHWLPQAADLPVKAVRWRPEAMSVGVEEKTLCGVAVRITDAARTVVDLFSYRNKIGVDVAIEALRTYLDGGNSSESIHRHARELGVDGVILPYLRMYREVRAAPSPAP